MTFQLTQDAEIFRDAILVDELWELRSHQSDSQVLGAPLGLGPLINDFEWPFSDVSLIEVSSFDSDYFAGDLHPEAFGYRWYRGIRVVHKNGQDEMLIFVPWVKPHDYHLALVVTVGTPDPEWVRQVTRDYIWCEMRAMRLVD